MRIGVDVGGTKVEGVVLDRNGQEVARYRVPTPQGDYEQTMTAIAAVVAELERVAGHAATVGIGIPGAISPATGLVKNANSTWLIGRPVDLDLEQILDRTVRIANDANCFAISEATDGAGQCAQVVFGVILGTGVGGGIVINNRAVVGANAIAGEWGHNPLPWPEADEWPGTACYCGRRGCIETFLSGPALTRQFGENSGRTMAPAAIAAAAATGDAEAEICLAAFERRLARALASVINILDPDVIVLGGGLSNIERLYRSVPVLWQQWVFSDRVTTELRRNKHGDSSGVRGAAWLWPSVTVEE